MTPKEKAIELYKKLVIHIQRYDEYVDERSKINTKQCALIAVDEILKAVDNPDETYLMKHSVNYWTEVKQEIEKL
jgi:hypothetical protein